ncbi:MAG: alpha/beta hydrolase [Clostridia bacterium]|nr:alpha/beta hydrolase [Clostridia bacterium]
MINITSFLKSIVTVFMSLLMTFLGNLGIATDHFDTYSAVQYGDSLVQVMDIYVPNDAAGKSENGAILFLHDGMFNSGSRSDMKNDCRTFTNSGYITAAMDYSFISQKGVSLFTMLDEITLAIQKLSDLSAEKGLNIKHLALAGKGAGGYLAMMYAYTNADYSAIDIEFVAAKAAPADFTPSIWQANYSDASIANLISSLSTVTVKTEDVTNNAANVAGAVAMISPTSAVRTGKKIPTVFAYAGKDSMVPIGNKAALEDALAAANVPNKSVYFDTSDHSMAIDMVHAAEYNNLITDYCNQYFK